jgi:hypothetical protein
MAVKTPTMCPDCYMFEGVDTPLDPPRAGAQARCPKGHTWDDMENLQNRLTQAKNKRAAVDRQNNPEPEETPEQKKKKIQEMQKPKGNEVVICEDDYKRISDRVGDFPDGATLYGKIFSIMEDLKNTQALLNDAMKKKSPTSEAKGSETANQEGGDLELPARIPEKHVEPLKAIAEAAGSTTVAYFNSIVENGLDNGWFY